MKRVLFLLLICVFVAGVVPVAAYAEAADIGFLEAELKEASRQYSEYTSDRAMMEQFIRDWQQNREELARTGAELRQFHSDGERINKNNLIKKTISLGMETYETGKDAFGVGVSAATRGLAALAKWTLGKVSGDTGKALAGYGGPQYYNKAMTPFTAEVGKTLPELQELQRILALDIPQMQATLMAEENIQLTKEDPTILAKWRLLLEKTRKAQDGLIEIVRRGDLTENDFKNKLVEMTPAIEQLEQRIGELERRLGAARGQQVNEGARQLAKAAAEPVVMPMPPRQTGLDAEQREEQLKKAYAIVTGRYPALARTLSAARDSYDDSTQQASALLGKARTALQPYQAAFRPRTPEQLRTELALLPLNELADRSAAAQQAAKDLEAIAADLRAAWGLLQQAEATVKGAAKSQAELEGLDALDESYGVFVNAKLRGWNASYKDGLAGTLPTVVLLEPVINDQLTAMQLLQWTDAAKTEQEYVAEQAAAAAGARVEALDGQLGRSRTELEGTRAAISRIDAGTGAIAKRYAALIKKSGYYAAGPQGETADIYPDVRFEASLLEKRLAELANEGDPAKLAKAMADYEQLKKDAAELDAAYKNSTTRADSFAIVIRTDMTDGEVAGLPAVVQRFPAAAKLQDSLGQANALRQELEQYKLIKQYSTLSGLPPVDYEPRNSPAFRLLQLEQEVDANAAAWLALPLKDFALQVSNVKTIIESNHFAANGLEPSVKRLAGKLAALEERYHASRQPAEKPKTAESDQQKPGVAAKPSPPTGAGSPTADKPTVQQLPANYQQLVRNALSDVAAAYQQKSLRDFMQNVSPDFLGDDYLLDRALRRDFLNFDYISLRFNVNSIQTDARGRAQVYVRYNRTVRAQKDGVTYSDHGVTQFTFHLKDGKVKLYDVKYPVIFGVSEASMLATGEVRTAENVNILAVSRRGEVSVLPYNDARNLSDQSAVKRGTGIRLQFSNAPLIVQGWSFADNRRTYPNAYHTVEGDFTFTTQWINLAPGTSFRLLGAADVADVTEVPDPSIHPYDTSDDLPAPPDVLPTGVGNVYALKLSSGKYAVIKIVSYTHLSEFVFDYKYQPSGSRRF